MALAKKPYVVIDAEILSSSVWSENPHIKLVWLTLLILCDTEGEVGASIPGIASAAGVTLAQAQEAIAKFQEPDPFSRTKTHDGRRLEVIDRGFKILNFVEHLDRLSANKRRTRERVRRHRERKKAQKAEKRYGNVTSGSGSRDVRDVGSRDLESRDQTSTDFAPSGAAVVAVKAKSWTAEACEDWSEFSGGVAPGGKIGSALKPLIAKVAREHGTDEAEAWSKVRPYWRKFCESDERKYGPHSFAENPKRVIEGSSGGRRISTVGDEQMEALRQIRAARGEA